MSSSPKRPLVASRDDAPDSPGGASSSSDVPARNCKRRKVSHDEKFQAMFDRLVEYKGEHGDCLVPYRWSSDPQLGKWVNSQRLLNDQDKLSNDRIRQLDSIGFTWRVKQRLLWDEMFQRLVDFKNKFGHCLVPQRYKHDPQLGRWVDTQRENKDRRLTPEHKQRLEEIGFVWSALKESWEEMFQRLVKYKEQHGDCQVTQRYTKDPKLGKWVKNQRLRRDCLSAERVARLEDIGFVWCVQKKQERDSWDKMYKKLHTYKSQNGNCLVPLGYKDDPRLSEWVHSHRRSKGSLTAHQVKRLNAIGFEWSVPEHQDMVQVVWDAMYERLKEYKTRHGTCEVLANSGREDYASLALWVQTQRAAKLFGGITTEQIERLEALGFSWQGNQDYLWNHQQEQLQARTAARQAMAVAYLEEQRKSQQSPPWVSGWESTPSSVANPASFSSRRGVSDLLSGPSNPLDLQLQGHLKPAAATTRLAAASLNNPLLPAQKRVDGNLFPLRSSPQDMLILSLMEKQRQERETLRKAQELSLSAVAGRQFPTPSPTQAAAARSLASLHQSRNPLAGLSTSALLSLRSSPASSSWQRPGPSSRSGANSFPSSG